MDGSRTVIKLNLKKLSAKYAEGFFINIILKLWFSENDDQNTIFRFIMLLS